MKRDWSCDRGSIQNLKNARFAINKYLLVSILILFVFSTRQAAGTDQPAYCVENPELAGKLMQRGPVMGLGSSVSHGLLARSASEIVADQLCLDSEGHVFPWYYPAAYHKAARYYYKHQSPELVIALDVTYHDMKVLEYTSEKIEVLDTLVPALALDCEDDFYDCSADGNEFYAREKQYQPTVIFGDLFFENLVDCSRGKPPREYRIENAKPRPRKLCFEEFAELGRHLEDLVARYPDVHLYPSNYTFTSLVKYPHSLFYDEGSRQTFFSRKELTWDGWHPYTDPGSKVFANQVIMYINRLIKDGRINGPQIPLATLSDDYFGPPSGLIIVVSAAFPPVKNPLIVGPDGRKVPLRFSLSRQWAEQHGVFFIGRSYFKARALAWKRLAPKPLLVRAQSYTGSTIVLSQKDRDILADHHRKGVALKGGLLIIGDDLDQKVVSREDTFFLNQLDKDAGILETLSPAPMLDSTSAWEY